MKRTVFLSYSSAQSEAATRIELSLKGEGHSVFRDRSALPPGGEKKVSGTYFFDTIGGCERWRYLFASSQGNTPPLDAQFNDFKYLWLRSWVDLVNLC